MGGSAPSLAEIARALEALSEVRRAGPEEEVVITSNMADTGRWIPGPTSRKIPSSSRTGWSASASPGWDIPPRCG